MPFFPQKRYQCGPAALATALGASGRSVTPDALISFEDNKPYKTLRRHLATHGLTPEQYRDKWGLPRDYPMVAPNYSAARSQMAKQLGAGKVIGSAGSPEKTAWLTELGFDVALNYKEAPIGKQLREHGPVDVYFDNVGGDHLEAAIFAMADFGRIAECGMIADYNADAPAPGPRNMMMMISKRLTMRGFIVSDHRGKSRRGC